MVRVEWGTYWELCNTSDYMLAAGSNFKERKIYHLRSFGYDLE